MHIAVGKSNKGKKQFFKYGVLSLMALPALVYFIVNNYMPMFYMFIAFKKISWKLGLFGSPWVGLDNFKFLFTTPDAWLMTRNTIGYNLLFLVISPVVSIFMAVLLAEIAGKLLRKLYQSAFIIPSLVSMTVVGYALYAFLNPTLGFVNTILGKVGKDGPDWYNVSAYWPYILTFTHIWKGCGYGSIVYLASIVGIDQSFYEAALIDGAKRSQKIRYITIPMIMPVVITLLLLNVGRIFYSDFGLFYQVPMNAGLLKKATLVIDVYVYKMLITQGDLAKSSAAGFYQSMVGFALVMLSNLVVRKIDPDSALF